MRKTILILILLITAVSHGQEMGKRVERIRQQLEVMGEDSTGLKKDLDINVTQTSLSNFLLAIAKVHGLNISVSSELSQVTIVNNFADVPVSDVLVFLVKQYDLDIEFTGNILSIKKFVAQMEAPKQKPLDVFYSTASGNITLDLRGNSLERVFRKIMDDTGANLLFTPDIAKFPLTIYVKDVPLETALEKLAQTNNLIYNRTRDGFHTFEGLQTPEGGNVNARPRRRSSSFAYSVIDTVGRRVRVDLVGTPVSDVIYTLGNDLGLDIFTASPLEQAGNVTVEASDITFDLLLEKIFGSATVQAGDKGGSGFTFKKEGKIYYFGREDQLTLKSVELIPMMHRSVRILDDPEGNMGRRNRQSSFSGNNFRNYQGTNQPIPSNNRNTEGTTRGEGKSILEIIPDDVKAGLDIKLDQELNGFIVSGPGANVKRFSEFIQDIDRPVPVILFEVIIMEVNRSALTETGISFGIGGAPTQTRGEFFPSGNVTISSGDVNKIIGSFNGFGALNIGKVVPNFYLDIKAMEASGVLKVTETPKLTTLNGHKAYLASGETTYYAVTSQSFYGSQIPQTSEIRNYVPIDAELSLEILPFVSANGQVTLDIKVIQSAFNGERIEEDAPPGIISREFSSIVRMEDQDVVVLGGIESIRKDDSGSGIPLLARIPILKWLFSKRRREVTKRDLNIVIKPTILN